jgi:hypothetical protein
LIDLKFIFNSNVVLTMHILKVAPIRMRFSPGFSPGAGFQGNNLIRTDHMGKSWFFAAPEWR